MKRVAILMAVPLLAACSVHSKNPASGDENVTINADESGQVSFNLPFINGNVKLPEGALHNGELDIDGVKMVPGGKITGFSVMAGDKNSTVNIAFRAPGSPDEVRAYFVDQFKQKGVTATQSGDAVSGKAKDGEAFLIRVQPAAEGSTGTIAIQDKD